MKKVFISFPAKLEVCRYKKLIFVLMFLGFVMGVAGFEATKEKAQKMEVHRINNENVRIKNIGCSTEELNPLRKDEHPEINSAMEQYFSELKKNEKFAEKYDDIHIYTKVGQYRDTYIVFAEYRMKIKDIYTEVPGLVTLYAVKNEESGQYQLDTKAPKEQDEEFVQTLLEHKDVQQLLDKTKTEYALALQSDALLAEALADLKDAYKDSEG